MILKSEEFGEDSEEPSREDCLGQGTESLIFLSKTTKLYQIFLLSLSCADVTEKWEDCFNYSCT